MFLGLISPATKVSSKDFRGGLKYSKIGRRIKSISNSQLRPSQKKALFSELEKRGKSGGLSKLETQGTIRHFIDSGTGIMSKARARGLSRHLEKITGYKGLSWSSNLAKTYSRISQKGGVVRNLNRYLREQQAQKMAGKNPTEKNQGLDEIKEQALEERLKQQAFDEQKLESQKLAPEDALRNEGLEENQISNDLINKKQDLTNEQTTFATNLENGTGFFSEQDSLNKTNNNLNNQKQMNEPNQKLSNEEHPEDYPSEKTSQEKQTEDPSFRNDPGRDLSATDVGFYTKQTSDPKGTAERVNQIHLPEHERRVLAVVTLLIASRQSSSKMINEVLTNYGRMFLGRMGIPLNIGKDDSASIITLISDSTVAELNLLINDLAYLPGVVVKTNILPNIEGR